jgi:osmotically inducible lipoprotein OsmB
MAIKHILPSFAACASLAACGDTLGKQALGGGVIGAGAAAITSGSIAQGAAIGAAGNIAFCQLNPGRCN